MKKLLAFITTVLFISTPVLLLVFFTINEAQYMVVTLMFFMVVELLLDKGRRK